MAYVPWTQELDKLKIHFPFESAALFSHFRNYFFFVSSKCSLTFLNFLFYSVFFQKDLASSKVIEPHSFIKKRSMVIFLFQFFPAFCIGDNLHLFLRRLGNRKGGRQGRGERLGFEGYHTYIRHLLYLSSLC